MTDLCRTCAHSGWQVRFPIFRTRPYQMSGDSSQSGRNAAIVHITTNALSMALAARTRAIQQSSRRGRQASCPILPFSVAAGTARTLGGSAAPQFECSICCSAIAVVQGCCLFSQTEIRGFSKSGSANIPTAIAISSGRCSGSQKTVPPHSGQKWNVTVLPLSARRAYRLATPLASRTCARG